LSNALLVGTGGFAGAVARYAVSGAVHRLFPSTTFPLGTLAVNTAGCLAIGFFAGLAETRQLFGPEARLFLLLGVLGGFTTYSTFGYETFALIRDSEHVRATAVVVAHLAIALPAVWLGHLLAGKL